MRNRIDETRIRGRRTSIDWNAYIHTYIYIYIYMHTYIHAEYVNMRNRIDETRIRGRRTSIDWDAYIGLARESGIDTEEKLRDVTLQLNNNMQIR